MIRLSRPRLGAALALVLAAAPTARAAEPDKLLPADADSVLYVNVRQILDSDIVKKYALEQMKQALQGNDAQKFLTDLGLDPLKDVEKVVVGASGKDQTDMKFLAVVHGKFDPEKLFKAAEAQTKKDADHFSLVKDGKDVMFKYQPDNGNPVYGTVVNETTVVVGSDKKIVTTALVAAAEGKKPAISKDLAALVTKMDEKASLWAVSVVKGKLDNVKLPGGGGNPAIQGQLANMESVTAVIRVTTDVNLDITLGMKDDATAEEMGKTLDELLQTVKGALPFLAAQRPELKPLVESAKSLKSTVKDKAVVVTAKLSGTAIGELLKQGAD
jgi:hypothetical protein